MSVYVRCPTCGSILADKEYKYIVFKAELDKKKLPEEERQKEIKKFLDSLTFTNYCCWMRIYTGVEYHKIIV